MTSSGERVADSSEVLSRICGEVAAIFSRMWGRGPARTVAYWAGPDILLVMLEDGHTQAEKTLRAAGHIQELVGGRQLLQVIVEDEMRAAVESATDRHVSTVLSATRLDPDVSAEVFVLEPSGGEPRAAGEHATIAERVEQARATAADLQEQTRAVSEQARQQRDRRRARSKD